MAAGDDEAWALGLGPDGQTYVGGNVVATGINAATIALEGLPVDQFINDGSADWDTAGSLDLFGVCLRDALNGATAGGTAWNKDLNTGADCADGDGDPWYAIPAASPGAQVAYMSTADTQGGATDPEARMRFGFRAQNTQQAGTYVAPIVFETVAPTS